MHHPAEVSHFAYAGGHHHYVTDSCEGLGFRGLVNHYQIPACPSLPFDALFDTTKDEAVVVSHDVAKYRSATPTRVLNLLLLGG